MKRIFGWMPPLLVILLVATFSWAGEKPILTRYDAHYLDHILNISIQWQSPNPVTKVMVTAGRDQKEIKIDEYDNRRNPSGYEGEVSATITVDPSYQLDPIPFIIQLEDDLRQRSSVVTGKATIPGRPQQQGGGYGGQQGYAPQGGYDDGWGREKLAPAAGMNQGGQPGQGGTGDMIDKLIGVMERHDTAPSLDTIKVNIHSAENVSFTSKANDDKGLREIRIRVYDGYGNQVQEQLLSGLGKVWQGTSQTFRLQQAGNYRVVAQASDTAGNTSKEQSATFSMVGATQSATPTTTPPISDQPQGAQLPVVPASYQGQQAEPPVQPPTQPAYEPPPFQPPMQPTYEPPPVQPPTQPTYEPPPVQPPAYEPPPPTAPVSFVPPPPVQPPESPPPNPPQQSLPSVSDPIIYSNGNISAVTNSPTTATNFSVDAAHKLTFIYTYHYFNKGKLPGTIALKHADGTVYGPWQAAGALGQGGVPNAYWFALPNIEIKPGRYMVIDSDNATWSHNSGSAGAGFVEIRGIHNN